ncbi:thiolase domain-containing protein [Dactylosporangium sp. CA-092794]|uniref:thiolase domain-containing protein n=1 Tax=Dactylosporangium sp. CA-092794 TaxID=3239929 RepID=UPI003D91F73D
MSLRGKVHIAGAYEHPGRRIPDRTVPQLHAEVALGALADAGLSLSDVDAYFCDFSAPGVGPLSMIEYLGLRCSHADTTEIGGSSYLSHVGHAAMAVAAGKCHVALVTMADRPLTGPPLPRGDSQGPERSFDNLWGITETVHNYAMVAMRHMYEFGTTSEQLAEVKVAASWHAQHNPNALLPGAVTVADVLSSPMISDPLHRLDCCITTDGGGAIVLVSPEVARTLPRATVALLGHAERYKYNDNGRLDLSHTGAIWSGPAAFEEAGVAPGDIDYAGIYDSFTITVVETLEDLGFCAKGAGGAFVSDGTLVAPHGRLPINTDGGSLCNNHPGGRGGMPKIIEAVRQLRGEAHGAVQVPDCELALVHGTGGRLGTRSSAATLILGAAA